MTINLESLPKPVQFAYISMTQSAIYFKECGHDKNFFLSFCDEIWNSMELSNLEYLKETLQEKMKKDIQPYVENYIKKSK